MYCWVVHGGCNGSHLYSFKLLSPPFHSNYIKNHSISTSKCFGELLSAVYTFKYRHLGVGIEYSGQLLRSKFKHMRLCIFTFQFHIYMLRWQTLLNRAHCPYARSRFVLIRRIKFSDVFEAEVMPLGRKKVAYRLQR